jgi:hypothetical protein
MADQPRLNKPVSDEALYAAGLQRNLPEREPVPLPPATLPDDTNPGTVGVEYRAMPGYVTADGLSAAHSTTDSEQASPFGWLARRRR